MKPRTRPVALERPIERTRAWWRALPRRQQWLVLGAAAVAGLGAVDTLIVAPAEQRHRELRQKIEAAEQQRERVQQAAAQAGAEQARLRDEDRALRERLVRADASIAQARAGLTSPEGLHERLRELTEDGRVRLVSLASASPEPVAVDGTATGQPGASGLYRFPVSVTVEGPYGGLRDYLARLESTDQGLHWHSVSLDNRRWPDVRLELRLALLSERPYWKGP